MNSKREKSWLIGEWMAEDFYLQGNLKIGDGWEALQMAALAAWPEVLLNGGGHGEVYCDEFVLGFKAKAGELCGN